MSRIFEALKQAQRTRPAPSGLGPVATEYSQASDRRRSRRWPVDISVYVYGHGPEKEPFHEEAHTLNVNANGALLLLSAPVHKGQALLLTNRFTDQEQGCRVVYLGTKHSRTIEAGIAFPESNPDFWQMPSQPEDKPAA